MRTRGPRARLVWLPALLAPLLAVALYWGSIDRRFDAPDLQFIQLDPTAAVALDSGTIWFEPLPEGRPDLAAYRPIHALLLKFEYSFFPARATSFRRVSLALFALFCLLNGLLAWRLIGAQRKGAVWAVAIASLLVAAHPMAAESVQFASVQGVLVAAVAWIAALLIYRLALERRLGPYVASPLVTVCYFVAFGAYELGVLLPFAILALDLWTARDRASETPIETKGERAAPPPLSSFGAFRFFIYGVPLSIAGAVVLLLRWIALGTQFFPASSVRALGDLAHPSRIVAGLSAFVLGFARLMLPIRPTLFYEPAYEPSVLWPLAAAVAGLALFVAVKVWSWKSNRRLGLGLILIALPLCGVFQIVPMTEVFSERMLLFALPGLGILAAEAALFAMNRLRSPARLGLGLLLVLAPLAAWPTLQRNRLWKDSNRLWAAEAEMHPGLPHPRTYRLITMISRSGGNYNVESIEAEADEALALAEPPDRDLVYQYLTVLAVERRDAEDLRAVLDRALQAEGPHIAGYFSALGIGAFRLGLLDRAEEALARALEAEPARFDALYAMAEVNRSRGRWEDVLYFVSRAALDPPPHFEAPTFYLYGLAAAESDDFQTAVAALTKAVDVDETLTPAYLRLARLFVENEEYARAELVLTRARNKARTSTYRDLFAIQVDSLERQGNQLGVYDFLREMTRRYPWDLPMLLYAAGYYVDHEQYRAAREVYNRIFRSAPRHPDALVGMGKIYALEDRDIGRAAQMWQRALQVNPAHAEARALMAGLRGEIDRRQTEPPPGGIGPSQGPPPP